MKNVFRTLLVAMAVLSVPLLVHAQTGCEDSPENPTLVLLLIGSAGALISQARARFRARRNSGE